MPSSVVTDTIPLPSPTNRSNLGQSFYYAGQGLHYALTSQRNFRIHVGIGTLALIWSAGVHLPLPQMAIIALTIGLVLALELVNTALEAVVDLSVGQTYHELARIAKDCAAAAVLVTALTAVGVAGLLLIPPSLAYRILG
ncbi:diacylglycerol kinase [Gloeomargarita lithophora Alchichica-D10]|uniref:Diacylglycerol kinase n=1 Tax=Gloeomargarita lithophora Alchichica-D10 TaxID=1188229 RepID=A0A1J0AAB6_9CYAN|nr:diacylglycerol kinase family protein [Gloeomargarita lithophora]APB32888.1 diacylglycerol kinase [Gloeomargarita lithophora Alchichica-D10]